MNSFSITKKVTIFLFLLVFGVTCNTYSQVSISPTSLFFDSQNRFSSLTVSNSGQQAQEISISTEFGYSTSKDGDLVIVKDSVLAQQKSIADWIKIFPQNFTLQPQQRQTVRFVAQPPNNLNTGGYWSRIKITSNPLSPPIESAEDGQVGAQINLVVNQVISAHYRTSNAETGIEVTSVNFTQEDNTNTGQIAVSMEQTASAPFVGSIQLSVKNADGESIYQTSTTNSVYTTITRTFNIDLSNIEPGEYTITGTVRSERRDINQSDLLQIQPVSFQKQITIE